MQPTKRMSPRPMSPKMLSWNKKLAMWRKNHRRADGSLPSLKAAMKACKGRRVSTKRCRRRKSFRKHRKAPGQYSPKKASPVRSARPVFGPQTRQAYEKRTGLKVQSAQKKQQSPVQKKQKPAVFGQKAPATFMFVPGTVKKQQSPAAQKKQQKPAQKKQQSPAAQKKQQKPAQKKQQQLSFGQRVFGGPAQKKQQKPAQRKPQFGQKAQAKPAPAMRFA